MKHIQVSYLNPNGNEIPNMGFIFGSYRWPWEDIRDARVAALEHAEKRGFNVSDVVVDDGDVEIWVEYSE